MKTEMTRRLFTCALACFWLAASSAAVAAEQVTVGNAWARATAPGQEVGAAYMDIKSATDATLTKVESPAADAVEIHMMSMKNGVMEMRMLETMPLPAGKVIKLEPGGFHLMLIDLKKPLKAGEDVAFTLHLRDAKGGARELKVTAPVKTGKD
jgi:periplasmic copper chaperone A